MNLWNSKQARAVKDAIEALGINVESGTSNGNGRLQMQIEHGGVRSKFTVSVPRHESGRIFENIAHDAKRALVEKGALFPKEPPYKPVPAAVQLPPVQVKPRRHYQTPRHSTRLTRQEKAEFYALHRSGQPFLEVCAVFEFSAQAGSVLVQEGDAGKFDDLLPEEYRAKKPAPAPEPARQVIVGSTRANPEAVAALEAGKAGQPMPFTLPPEPAARSLDPGTVVVTVRPRISPLDPRLLQFHKEHDLLQGHAAEVKRLAAELGIDVRVVVEVDWS